jgi:hypothetical protein
MLERAEAIDGIRRGLASMKKGGGVPLEKVFTRLVKKYGILVRHGARRPLRRRSV